MSCECIVLLTINKHLDSVIYFSMTCQGYQMIFFLFHLVAEQAHLQLISAGATASDGPINSCEYTDSRNCIPNSLGKLQAPRPMTQIECQSGIYSSMRNPAIANNNITGRKD